MYYAPGTYPFPYYTNVYAPMYQPAYAPVNYPVVEGYDNNLRYGYVPQFPPIPTFYSHATLDANPRSASSTDPVLRDYGPEPFTINIEKATKQNTNFRTALWTGEHFQVTLMSIPVGEDIGLETHPTTDQFIRIEDGRGLVQMGESKEKLDYSENVYEEFAIMIPAGKWHNLTNTGNKPLKVYVIYAPPEHPRGTIHKTKADAMAEEDH